MAVRRNSNRRRLTAAEEEIMQILWKQGSGLIKDILEDFDAPKPAYNTISTVLRVMEKKGFVSHQKVGVFYEFVPLVKKEEYAHFQSQEMLKGYYDNSLMAFIEDVAPLYALTEDDIQKISAVITSAIQRKSQRKFL